MAPKNALRIDIPNPCNEDWDQMSPRPNNQRFCSSCQKTLTDFSKMTDAEVVATIQQNNGKMCGRFRADQLRRNLYLHRPKNRPWTLIAAALSGVGLATSGLAGQSSTPTPVANSIEQVDNVSEIAEAFATETRNIKGIVTDSEGVPLIGATVIANHTKRGTVTDIDGRFELVVKAGDQVIEVSYVGFSSQTVALSLKPDQQIAVTLDTGITLNEVVVKADARMYWVGDISGPVPHIDNEQDKAKIVLPEFETYLQEATVFPNPFHQPPQLRLESPLNHQLKLQPFNAAGVLLWQQRWEIEAGANTFTLPSVITNYPSGTYYLYLKDENKQERILTLVRQ